jgi:hypothetical protein
MLLTSSTTITGIPLAQGNFLKRSSKCRCPSLAWSSHIYFVTRLRPSAAIGVLIVSLRALCSKQYRSFINMTYDVEDTVLFGDVARRGECFCNNHLGVLSELRCSLNPYYSFSKAWLHLFRTVPVSRTSETMFYSCTSPVEGVGRAKSPVFKCINHFSLKP